MALSMQEVVERTRTMERLLRDNYGATGKGLHELADSVQDRLPPDVMKKIRFIASVRNKYMHEDGYEFDGDAADFLRSCDGVIAVLSRTAAPPVAPPSAPRPAPAKSPAPPLSAPRPAPAAVEYPAYEPAWPGDSLPQPKPWYGSLFGLIVGVLLFVTLLACALTLPFLMPARSSPARPTATAATRSQGVATLAPVPAQRAIPPTAVPAAACVIQWREVDGAMLAGINLETAWESIVKQQVAASGMTREQFYALMKGENPHLAQDSFFFKKGQKYLLPRCN